MKEVKGGRNEAVKRKKRTVTTYEKAKHADADAPHQAVPCSVRPDALRQPISCNAGFSRSKRREPLLDAKPSNDEGDAVDTGVDLQTEGGPSVSSGKGPTTENERTSIAFLYPSVIVPLTINDAIPPPIPAPLIARPVASPRRRRKY